MPLRNVISVVGAVRDNDETRTQWNQATRSSCERSMVTDPSLEAAIQQRIYSVAVNGAKELGHSFIALKKRSFKEISFFSKGTRSWPVKVSGAIPT